MTTELKIEGMMCSHCTGSVKKALSALEGVKEVEVSLTEKNAVIEHEDLDPALFVKAVEALGFRVVG